jgi:putative Ca2+/H+ antiporter (TMEM165/GDT1 family)
MNPFLASTGLVVLAEMGDKTQLLAMALACRFRWQTVMLGVLAATLCNHFLAVVAGTYLTKVIPLYYVQVAASASFILFGFWTLRGDTLEGEDKRFNYSPFWTVAVAFFLAEMGDKTQLATVALAAEYKSIIAVWLGTTTGMLIADAIGIGVGIVLGKKIPERLIKWVAALIFIFFGLSGLYDLLPGGYFYPILIFSGLGILGFLLYEAFWGRKKAAASHALVCEPGKESKIPSPVEGAGKTSPEAGE